MANIVITNIASGKYKIEFNSCSDVFYLSEKYFWSSDILYVSVDIPGNVILTFIDGFSLIVNFNGDNGICQVDSVAGGSPTSNSDLASKLVSLRT